MIALKSYKEHSRTMFKHMLIHVYTLKHSVSKGKEKFLEQNQTAETSKTKWKQKNKTKQN